MPRLSLIVLEQDTTAPASRPTYNIALWSDGPAARQSFYANPSAKSHWSGAQAADTTALQSGAMVEKVVSYSPEASKTLPQMEADLQAIALAYQAQIAAFNAWARYGSTWDGTTWVGGGVA